MKISQNKQIIDYLLKGNSITQAKAVELFGCYRLSARIHDLREEGYSIKATTKIAKNRYGNAVSFAEYELVKE